MTDKPNKIKVYVYYAPEEKIWMANATEYWICGVGMSKENALSALLQAFHQERKLRTDSLENCRRGKPLCKPNLVLEK